MCAEGPSDLRAGALNGLAHPVAVQVLRRLGEQRHGRQDSHLRRERSGAARSPALAALWREADVLEFGDAPAARSGAGMRAWRK